MAKITKQTTEDVRHDYEHLARLANLRYARDDEPGYERRRHGVALLIAMPLVIR
ncbi:hypothetical protein [Psychrobacter sp. 72-O-c]|uniref:hypothetical protein n=1 Tax=Psychrobacter sp. 72-O-c TaxID=2774125 RepID=UPI001D110D03|nr:hypothetical protein [Psychrobacter sp. 72-O-c]